MIADVAVAFAAGAVSFFAPCVVPLLPAYVGYIAGAALPELRRDPRLFQARLIRGGLLYVLGFSVIFVALGVLAGVVGSRLRAETAIAERVGGVIVLVMGLALAGLLPGRLRALAERDGSLLPAPAGAGGWAPLLLGLTFGTAWTPCVGPVLAGILVLAASTGHALSGGLLLAAYAAGLGLPFIVASLVLASFPVAMAPVARAGAALGRVSGGLLAVVGVLLISGVYQQLAGYLAAPFAL